MQASRKKYARTHHIIRFSPVKSRINPKLAKNTDSFQGIVRTSYDGLRSKVNSNPRGLKKQYFNVK